VKFHSKGSATAFQWHSNSLRVRARAATSSKLFRKFAGRGG
jgi:hypothetical protein